MDQINHRMIALSMLALAGSAYGAHVYFNDSSDESRDREMLENRLWLDRTPTGGTDLTHAFIFISNAGDGDAHEGLGIEYEFSDWRMHQDGFLWEANHYRSRLALNFPQDPEDVQRYSFSVTDECSPPDDFELCLVVSRGDGEVRVYFSRWDLGMDSTDDATAKIRALAE